MKIKKYLALALAALLTLSTLTACGGKTNDNPGNNSNDNPGTEASQPGTEATQPANQQEQMAAAGIQTPNTETGNTQKTDETIVIQLGGYPDYFWHPGTDGSNGTNEEQIINAATLDRLVDYDEAKKEVVPMLAESWEMDGASFTFHLRSGVKMTDGSDLVADDVVFTVNRWKESCASNDTGKYIESVTKVDDSTVTITFNSVAPDIIKMLTWSNFGIVSEDEINALGGFAAAAQNPVMGSGKYRFKDCKQGEYVILERNEDYWDPNYAGYFKTIKFTFVSDPNSMVSAVMSGDAQVAWGLPVSQASTFAQNGSVRTYLYSNGEVEHLFFNRGEGHPTSDLKVRQAIAKALNYPAIATVATAGYGGVALSYANSAAPYWTSGWTEAEMAQDIEGAKALLAEAGYDASNPLKISAVTMADQVDLYTVMQANLKEAGIELEIQQVDMGGFVPAMLFDKSYDIVAIGDDITFRAPHLTQFVAPGMSFGGPNMVLEDHMEILGKIIAATDDATAKAGLEEYHAKLKEDMTCVNLYEALGAAIVGADIKGYAIRERAYIDVTTLYK